MIKNKPVSHLPGRLLALIALVFFVGVALPEQGYAIESAAANTNTQWVLHAEQWEAARAGDRLLSLTVLQQVVNAWAAKPNQKIELNYPGGEDGDLWVAELEDWLVSLGVPSRYMSAVPGSGNADQIRFQIIQTGD